MRLPILRAAGIALAGALAPVEVLGGSVTYTNSTPISTGDNASGSPYPSMINVPSFSGNVVKVTVMLKGFGSHLYPRDVDVLLVGPTGQTLLLMSDVGGLTLVNGQSFTFDDAGPALVAVPLVSGRYRPTDVSDLEGNDVFGAPAPASPYGTTLSVFNGLNPVGNWNLYVRDDFPGGAGSFAGGWSLSLEAASWSEAGSTTLAYRHSATLLQDGRVLLAGGGSNAAGGGLNRAEVYDPRDGSRSPLAPLSGARERHTATLLGSGKVLVVAGDNGGSAIGTAELYDPRTGTWTGAGSISARRSHTATRLRDGRVLVAGGANGGTSLTSAFLYNPSTGTWTSTAAMASPRRDHTATLLPDGRVLVCGGIGATSAALASAEVFDPAAAGGAGAWVATAMMSVGRHFHTATLLPNGRVLVVAGSGDSAAPDYKTTAEIFDPLAGAGAGGWSTTGALVNGRHQHAATLLPDGRVLVTGGTNASFNLNSSELFDTGAGTWSPGPSFHINRREHTATLLADGSVFVAGGFGFDVLPSTERLGLPAGSWSFNTPIAVGRSDHGLVLLSSGKLLLAGGFNGLGGELSCQLYDPSTGTWAATGSQLFAGAPGVLLPNGKVLAVGGVQTELYDPSTATWTLAVAPPSAVGSPILLASGKVLAVGNPSQLYDPASGTWSSTGAPIFTGASTTTLLADGRVLRTGGYSNGIRATSEVYDPATGSWSSTGFMTVERYGHTATLLPSGKVLAAGGFNSGGVVFETDLFDPVAGTWSPTASLVSTGIAWHTATLLPDGRVLTAGGSAFGGADVEALLYDPAIDTWSVGGTLGAARGFHAAALLPDGRVLVTGGLDAVGAPMTSSEIFDPSNAAPARRPVLNAASDLSYGVPLTVTGTKLGGDSEAASGGSAGSASNHPVLMLRSLENALSFTLLPDPRPNFGDDPMTLSVSPPTPTCPGCGPPAQLPPGWYRLNVVADGIASTARILQVTCSLAIATHPQSQTVPLGAAATFSVVAQGAISYQWQKDPAATGAWTDIAGAISPTYVTPPAAGADSGSQYRVLIRKPCAAAAVASNAAALTVSDASPPTASVVSPAGGEYWLLSDAAGPASTRLVSWTMSDDVRICQAEVRLRFSNDGGASYQDAPASGGLPATFGTGGGCSYPGVTVSNLVYGVPTSFPSGVSGSLYKIQLVVSDQTGLPGHTVTVASANPFYIVRPNPDSVRSLILSNLPRMQALGMSTTALSGKLQELAANPKVQGLVVDLGSVTALSPLYAAWDADAANAGKANDVLFATNGVHDYLKSLLQAYTGVRYLLLVGDDRIIPFARVADHTTLLPESTYANGSGLTALGTTVGQALAANKYLSDDPLAVLDPVLPSELSGNLYIPDLAVGRLVETPNEITQAIATFISQDGVLDLTGATNKVLVTGYDFLLDAAKQVDTRWTTAYGAGAVDATRVSADWGLGSIPARVDSLKTGLCASEGVLSLSGHATHFEEGVPGADPFDIQGLTTSAMADANACGAGLPLDLAGRVVYALGCHGGLPVTGSAPADNPLDLPETLLGRGVVAYVANTGYGWGLKNGIGYGERLMQLLTEELAKGGTRVVGDAVKRAKQRYYLETPRYDSYDEKSLMQWTLYGLPMYAVKTGIPTGSRPSLVLGTAPTAGERPGFEHFGRVAVEQTIASLPSHLTRLDLHFDFTAPGVYTKWSAAGDTLPATPGCPDPSGCYYTLNGLVDRATGAADLPVQPYFIYDSRLSGTSQHGVLWKGGSYDEEAGWVPVVGELVSNGGDGSDHGSAPRLMFTRPAAPRIVQGLDPDTCRPSDLELNSLTVPAGEAVKDQEADPAYTIERHYRSIDLEVLYYNNTGSPAQNCDRSGPALGAGPFAGAYHQVSGSSLAWAVPASDPSGVWRVLVVANDNSASLARGAWTPVELVDDGSGTWRGSETFAGTARVTYVIQAVDTRGNVTWLDYVSAQTPASGVPLGVPEPVDVAVGPAQAPTIAGFTPARGPVGLTVRIAGANLAGATQVMFGGAPAAIASNSGSLITTSVPAGALTGAVTVITPAGIATSVGVFTVAPPAALSINDARVREGNAGTRNASFRVWLSAPSTQTVTVDYATSNGTAIAGSDYSITTGSLTFPPFVRGRTVNVPILGDTAVEGNERFFVTLSNPVNTTMVRAQGRGTIVDDDR